MNTISTAQANYSFNVESTGKNHRFTYKKSKLGFRTALPLLWLAFPVSIYLALGNFSRGFNITYFLFSVGLYMTGIVLILMLLINLLRPDGSFTVAEDGIELKGKIYPFKTIHSFYIKTPKGGKDVVIIKQYGAGYGIGSSLVGIGSEVGEALKESIRNKNYKICMLFGEKEKVLAGGLTDKTAKVMFDKLDELI